MAEHEKPQEAEAGEVLAQPNAEAVSIALGRASRSKAIDAKAAVFLDKQSRLADLQAEHLHEQRELQLEHLRVRRWRDRVSLALQALGGLVGAAAAVALALMVWDAHEDHGLVVEAFSTPPDLAQKGLNGQVVASLLMDKVAQMDAQSQSVRAGSSYKNSWGDDIKVEIPETGVSIGELDHWLRAELGHQTHISGELFHTPAGLAFGMRVEGQPGVLVSGSEAELDAMVTRAAEATYLDTQPYRFSKYLEYQGRTQESLAVVQKLATSDVPDDERAWAYAQISNLLANMGQPEAAILAGRRAVQLNPHLALGHLNLGDALAYLGHDGDAEAQYSDARDALARSMNDMSRGARLTLPNRIDLSRDGFRGDYTDLEAVALHRVALPDFQQGRRIAAAIAPSARARRHDPSGARDLRRSLGVPRDVDLIVFASRMQAAMMPNFDEAVAAEDWPRALAVLDETLAASLDAIGPFGRLARERNLIPLRVLVLTRLGRLDEAAAAIAPLPPDCYLCLRARGQLAAARGDMASANRWFAQALRQSPDLPQAELEWGRILLDRGEADAALAKARAAARKGPHWADPAELTGEALLRQGDFAGAAAAFRQADPFAPHWGRNHLRWGEALARQGDGDGARDQFLAARNFDLDAGDRARLKVWLAFAHRPA